MAIRNDEELEAAVQEYQRLRTAPRGSDGAARLESLNADIQTYYHQNSQKLRPAKPAHEALPDATAPAEPIENAPDAARHRG